MREDCEICGARDPLPLGEKRRGVDAVICRHCGLVWNHLMRGAEEQVEFYKGDYRGPSEVTRKYLGSMLGRGACVMEFLKDVQKPGMRHLDIGCAEGTLLSLTRAEGLEVAGMEIDENFSRFSREVRHLDVTMATLDDASPPEKPFDLVSFVHVVEHLFHPIETLRQAAGQLREGGYLFIEVPNVEKPTPGPGRFFTHVHNFYFTANTLRSLVAKAGFTPLRVGASRRDGSVQLLARKSTPQEAAESAKAPPQWRDNPQRIRRFIKANRINYYTSLRFITRKAHQKRLIKESLQRYEAALDELGFNVAPDKKNAPEAP